MAIGYGNVSSDGWVLFYRHLTSGGYWSSANGWAEVLRSNEYDLDSAKFSQLYRLDDSFKINGEFVLKLVMDNHTNIWAQAINPKDNAPTAATVTGYRPISISTTGNSWGGISRSDSGSSFLDGNPAGSNWYYPIGPGSQWNGGLPQYDGAGHPSCELWVKIK